VYIASCPVYIYIYIYIQDLCAERYWFKSAVAACSASRRGVWCYVEGSGVCV
jgi:hypothetical protein